MPRASRTIYKEHLTRNKKLKLCQLSTVNCQLFKTGFTLIEFLVVLGILALVVGSITLFLTSMLKGTNQANILAEVKQNGQVTLDSVERQIRGALDAREIGTNNDHLMITRDGADPLHIQCFAQSADKNDRIGTAVSPIDDPAINNYVSLSNDDPVSGASITGCDFRVNAADFSSGAPAVVSISFLAMQGFKAAQRVDFEAQAAFRTTISLRTYK